MMPIEMDPERPMPLTPEECGHMHALMAARGSDTAAAKFLQINVDTFWRLLGGKSGMRPSSYTHVRVRLAVWLDETTAPQRTGTPRMPARRKP